MLQKLIQGGNCARNIDDRQEEIMMASFNARYPYIIELIGKIKYFVEDRNFIR